mgnify:CR=1 FL=1
MTAKKPRQKEHIENEETGQDELTQDMAELQSELERLTVDAQEAHDRYLRTLADFDNYRKRQREETARQVGLVREELILKLLPVLDNFERALQAAEAQHSYESLVEGVSLTLRQIRDIFAREGIEPIEAVGQEFNPELHEAVMRVDNPDVAPNTIVEEVEKGYKINGKVLRPSRVTVAAGE